MEKLNYDQFFAYIWEDSTWLAQLVSVAYLEENDDFIRALTFDMYNLYDKSDIPLQLILKSFEIFFFNLFRFKGGNNNIEELKDNAGQF
jgi:hypothetical protein